MPTGADLEASTAPRLRPLQRLGDLAGSRSCSLSRCRALPACGVPADGRLDDRLDAGRHPPVGCRRRRHRHRGRARRHGTAAPLATGTSCLDYGRAYLASWCSLRASIHLSKGHVPVEDALVTAVKCAEYALIALAVPLVLRKPRDVSRSSSLVAVSAAASAVAVVQFFGVDVFLAWPSGGRQPGFVGIDELGRLSAGAYAVALGTSRCAAHAGRCACSRGSRASPAPWASSPVRSRLCSVRCSRRSSPSRSRAASRCSTCGGRCCSAAWRCSCSWARCSCELGARELRALRGTRPPGQRPRRQN